MHGASTRGEGLLCVCWRARGPNRPAHVVGFRKRFLQLHRCMLLLCSLDENTHQQRRYEHADSSKSFVNVCHRVVEYHRMVLLRGDLTFVGPSKYRKFCRNGSLVCDFHRPPRQHSSCTRAYICSLHSRLCSVTNNQRKCPLSPSLHVFGTPPSASSLHLFKVRERIRQGVPPESAEEYLLRVRFVASY